MEDTIGLEAAVVCRACTSPRLVWRVKRAPDAATRRSARVLVWTCKDCGAGWEESLGSASAPAPSGADAASGDDGPPDDET